MFSSLFFPSFTRAFDYKSERGEVCQGGSLIPIQSVLIRLKKIRFFKGDVKSGSTFHISIGHHTIPGTLTLFTDTEKQGESIDMSFIRRSVESQSVWCECLQ